LRNASGEAVNNLFFIAPPTIVRRQPGEEEYTCQIQSHTLNATSVPFRLPQKEYEALREFADSHGLRISDVCRTAVTGYIETVGRLREQNKAQQIPDSHRRAA